MNFIKNDFFIQQIILIKKIDNSNLKFKIKFERIRKQMIESVSFKQSNDIVANNEQQFMRVLNSLLPEIQQQLMKDIQKQLQVQFQEKYQKIIQEIDIQALSQYEQAIIQLQQSRIILQQQKEQDIAKQIKSSQQTLSELEEQLLIKLQQKFLEQNFDSIIMEHDKIASLQKQIEEQIYSSLQQKHEATKHRQIKQLIIAHQTKQIKLRKQLDQQIKSKIYCSSGLQELKLEIKQSKTQIGSQKSEYNLKLKKIDAQIKEYQDKIKSFQKIPDIELMRNQFQELKIQLIHKQTQQQIDNNQNEIPSRIHTPEPDSENQNCDSQRSESNSDSLEGEGEENVYQEIQNASDRNDLLIHARSNSQTLKRQKRHDQLNYFHQFQNQKSVNENQQSESQNVNDRSEQEKKFDLTAYFKGYLLNLQTAKLVQSKDIDRQKQIKQNKTLLNLKNVTNLLKQKIIVDPLQRYLNQQSVYQENNRNTSNLQSNQKTSNFAILYEQHLKNLNKAMARNNNAKNTNNKKQGLSQMAKKIIIKNLSTSHQNRFMLQKVDQTGRLEAFTSTQQESFKNYDSNLLSSCK